MRDAVIDKSDNELEDDFIEKLEKGYDSEDTEEFSSVQKPPLEEEVFVIKKKKSKSKPHTATGDGDSSGTSKKKKVKSLRDTITHEEGESQSKEDETTESNEEEPKINSKLASAVEKKLKKRESKAGEQSESESENNNAGGRINFGGVVEIPKTFEKRGAKSNAPAKPLKSILKKSSYAEEPRRVKKANRKKNVSLNLKEDPKVSEGKKKKSKKGDNEEKKNRPSTNWQLRETTFTSQVQNGIETFKNPLYDPQLVALRLQLDGMKQKAAKVNSEPAVLDMSGRELTSLPPIICKHTYLTVINLYMNQIRSLPPEIGKIN